jgi:hypothetical protein
MKFTGWTLLSLAILVLGIAFWVWMGTTRNNWTDVGVYSVGVTLIGFGLVGTLVSLGERRASA